MAAAAPNTPRALVSVLRLTRSRPVCDCLHARPLRRKIPQSSRNVSSASPQLSEMEVEAETPPRWSQTPPAMKAPFPSRPRNEVAAPIECNSDPRKLNNVYIRFLGQGGDQLLSEETKWLAVTAKSFDHGRRGFNDRLAFLGKRVLELQCSLGLLGVRADSSHFLKDHEETQGREHFSHPATEAIEVLSGRARNWFTHHKQLSKLATQYGFPEIVRWRPKMPDNLVASGSDLVYAQALMAVVGALALEQGSAVANRIARERILIPLGLKADVNAMLSSPQES